MIYKASKSDTVTFALELARLLNTFGPILSNWKMPTITHQHIAVMILYYSFRNSYHNGWINTSLRFLIYSFTSLSNILPKSKGCPLLPYWLLLHSHPASFSQLLLIQVRTVLSFRGRSSNFFLRCLMVLVTPISAALFAILIFSSSLDCTQHAYLPRLAPLALSLVASSRGFTSLFAVAIAEGSTRVERGPWGLGSTESFLKYGHCINIPRKSRQSQWNHTPST